MPLNRTKRSAAFILLTVAMMSFGAAASVHAFEMVGADAGGGSTTKIFKADGAFLIDFAMPLQRANEFYITIEVDGVDVTEEAFFGDTLTDFVLIFEGIGDVEVCAGKEQFDTALSIPGFESVAFSTTRNEFCPDLLILDDPTELIAYYDHNAGYTRLLGIRIASEPASPPSFDFEPPLWRTLTLPASALSDFRAASDAVGAFAAESGFGVFAILPNATLGEARRIEGVVFRNDTEIYRVAARLGDDAAFVDIVRENLTFIAGVLGALAFAGLALFAARRRTRSNPAAAKAPFAGGGVTIGFGAGADIALNGADEEEDRLVARIDRSGDGQYRLTVLDAAASVTVDGAAVTDSADVTTEAVVRIAGRKIALR